MANVSKLIFAAAIAVASISTPALAALDSNPLLSGNIVNPVLSGNAVVQGHEALPPWSSRIVIVDFGQAEVRKRFRNPRSRLLTLLLSRRLHPLLFETPCSATDQG